MTRGFPLMTRAILSWMARILWADFMVNLWLVVTQKWCLEEHGRSLTKGQNTVNFSAVFCCGGDPNLSAGAVETRRIRSAQGRSGTRQRNQGVVSSTISGNWRAVLLAGILGKTAPRRIWIEEKR